MSIIKPKNRMISFRLSEEDYEALKAVCASRGVRSVSDFARLAIEDLISGGGVRSRESFSSRLDLLDSRVQVLNLAVERLSRLSQVPEMAREASQGTTQ